MRITFFSHYFPPEGNAPASRTYENCARWVKAGHDVRVITSAPNCPSGKVYEGYRNRLFQQESVDGIRVARVWSYIAANKGRVRRIVNYVSYMLSAICAAVFLGKPDVVVATSPQFFCGWAGVITSKLRRVPLILEIRDIWPEAIMAVGAVQHNRAVRALEWLEVRMYAAADRIVTVGEGYRKVMIAKGVPPDKISVIMNGVDRELFTPQACDEALKARYGLSGKLVVSYVGTIGMACGLDVVIRAAEILKREKRDDVVFLLVGDGATREELEREARAKALNNVLFTGRQPKELMPAFLSISDVSLIHLKKKELFTTVIPSKFFEAAGMKRPIINGVAGCAAEMIEKAGAGICIEPENENQLVAAVKKLAERPDLRESLGNSGYEYVVKHHVRDLLAQEYLKILESVVDGHSVPV